MVCSARLAFVRFAVGFALILTAITGSYRAAPAPAGSGFTAGNVVIYRVGSGAGSLVNTGNPVFVDEYTPAGTLVQSVALPTAVNGANKRLIASGTATSEGLLTRSADKQYLILSGYDADLGTSGLAGTNAAVVARVVGRIDADGNANTATGLTDWASANNPRGATSSDGLSLWIAGAAGGPRYTTLGATASTQLSSTVTNLRAIQIFDGQLYTSTSSGSAVRIGAVGSGLPTSGGQTIVNLSGFPASGSPYGFFFADLDAGVAGVDTLYVADDGAEALRKYSLVAGSWVLNGAIGTSSDAYRGLTGSRSGTTVTLFATRKGGSGATGGGELVKLIDSAGYNGAFTGVPVVLATAAANTAFRGVALAPEGGSGEVTPPAIVTQPSSQSINSGAMATLNVSATGTAPLSYQWFQGNAGDTATPVGVDSPAFSTPALFLTTSYWVRVANAAGSIDSVTATITVSPLPPPCSAPYLAIHDIQGAGNSAAILGTVTVKGVVVGDYEGPSPALRGFYLQDLNPDANPETSEGIFVFEGVNTNSVSLGRVVQVTGNAEEFQGQTQINADAIEGCGATATVTPVDVAMPFPPPVNGVPYLERFEGMLTRFPQTLSVTEHFQLGRFGQVVVSSNGRLAQPTHVAAPGAAAQALQAANDLNALLIDDDLQNQNPDPILFGRNGAVLSAMNTLRGGDTALGLTGVMTYTWAGNSASGNAYRLRPFGALGGVASFQPSNPRPTALPTVGGRLRVASFNVLNYFLTLDVGTQANCGPLGFKQECRGAETASELERQQQKLNQALVKLDADIVGMMELENTQDGMGFDVNPLADIVSRLNNTLGGPLYDYVNSGIVGTDTIRVGIIFKTGKVTPLGAVLIDNAAVHNRPPVAQSFTENATGERFSVVVNHFKSKGCDGATGANLDQGDGQACWNALRAEQAQALAAFVTSTVVTAAGDSDVLLIGDFNSYAKEDPIRALETGGFTNLLARFFGPATYSYVFDGQWGYLDHGLASASMLSQVAGAADYHINADEPSVLDYNTNFKTAGQVSSLYNSDEYRTSDHDPVVIGITLLPLPRPNPDTYTVETGNPLSTAAVDGVLANDANGPLAIIGHTNPAHGALTLNADGSFVYTAAPGFFGTDTFDYTVSNGVQALLYKTDLPPLATIGGVRLTSGAFGSALTAVPGTTDRYYGLTDRGPNVDGPGGIKIEPLPDFTPAIGKFRLVAGGAAVLEEVIPLRAADGTPFSGRVNTQADTGETIKDLNGVTLPKDPNGFDSEGLAVAPDGTFWISDEYGPFIAHFAASGREIERLSPFNGKLPAELAARVVNRGMEGLTITPDGATLVGIMQSALQQADLAGFDAKRLTPLRIVTYRLADGAVHEYLYLLDDPEINKTAVSEITVLSDTTFLVLERDGNFPPASYKRLFKIDISGATDVGPASLVPGAGYNAAAGGLLVGGQTVEWLLRNQNTAASAATLTLNGITTVSKALYLNIDALLTFVDAPGRFFSHDKIEGIAVANGGATLVIGNDSDFGIDGVTNSGPVFQLRAKISPRTGLQDDGEFLVVDAIRATATVTIRVQDTIAPETALTGRPDNPSSVPDATFTFTGSDFGSGVSGFQCALDGAAYTACSSGVHYLTPANGPHTFAVRAVDAAGNIDATPEIFAWIVAVPPHGILAFGVFGAGDAADDNTTTIGRDVRILGGLVGGNRSVRLRAGGNVTGIRSGADTVVGNDAGGEDEGGLGLTQGVIANGKVTLNQLGVVLGPIYGDEIRVGRHAIVAGDVAVRGQITMTQQAAISGDADGAAASLGNDASIGGVLTLPPGVAPSGSGIHNGSASIGSVRSGAPQTPKTFDRIVLPAPATYTPATTAAADRAVAKSASLTLTPGVYRDLILKQGATVNLRAGIYIFRQIDAAANATLNIDVSGGRVTIFAAGNVDLGQNLTVNIVGGSAKDVLLEAAGAFAIGVGSKWQGTVFSTMSGSPGHNGIDIGPGSTVKGALYSNQQVRIARDSRVTFEVADAFAARVTP